MSNRRLWASGLLLAVFVTGCGGSGTGNTGGGNNGGGGSGGGGGNNQPTTVAITFLPGTPSVVATKIGSGALSAQTLTSNTLTLSIPQGTTNFAVAFVCTATFGTGATQTQDVEQTLIESTTVDGISQGEVCVAPNLFPGTGSTLPPQSGALSYSVDMSAIAAADQLYLAASNGTDSEETFESNESGVEILPAGNDVVDVLAFQYAGGFGPTVLVAAKQYTNQPVPGSLNGGNTVVLGSADEVTTEPITYQNIPSGFTQILYASYWPAGNGLGFNLAENPSSFAANYPVVPSSMAHSGDLYEIDAFANRSNGSTMDSVSVQTLNSSGPVSIQFPPVWSYSGPAPAGFPTIDFSAFPGFGGTSGVAYSVGLDWGPSASGVSDGYGIEVTANAMNGATSLAAPDLSGLAGFLKAPASGTQVNWGAGIGQGRPSIWVDLPFTQGTLAWASARGSYTVP